MTRRITGNCSSRPSRNRSSGLPTLIDNASFPAKMFELELQP